MENKKIRLDKYLSNMGIGSRTEVKKQIRNGFVTVNGKPVSDPGTLIGEEEVCFCGEKVVYREFFYLMLHKPQGVLTATEDSRRQTVLDLLDPQYRKMNLFPVGRLDKDTEGLLLLTNDGSLAHNLLSPKKGVSKKYFAKVRGRLCERDIESFEEGIVLSDGYRCLPAKLSILSSEEISEVEVRITEGKFHQVKRMFRAVGKEVLYLKRLSMGELILDAGLPLGGYRELTEEEKKILEKYR